MNVQSFPGKKSKENYQLTPTWKKPKSHLNKLTTTVQVTLTGMSLSIISKHTAVCEILKTCKNGKTFVIHVKYPINVGNLLA